MLKICNEALREKKGTKCTIFCKGIDQCFSIEYLWFNVGFIAYNYEAISPISLLLIYSAIDFFRVALKIRFILRGQENTLWLTTPKALAALGYKGGKTTHWIPKSSVSGRHEDLRAELVYTAYCMPILQEQKSLTQLSEKN